MYLDILQDLIIDKTCERSYDNIKISVHIRDLTRLIDYMIECKNGLYVDMKTDEKRSALFAAILNSTIEIGVISFDDMVTNESPGTHLWNPNILSSWIEGRAVKYENQAEDVFIVITWLYNLTVKKREELSAKLYPPVPIEN